MSFVDLPADLRNSAVFGIWHAPCERVNKHIFPRCPMFTKFNTKLDKAVILSVVAMIGFNVVVLTQQMSAAPHYALSHSAAAAQA
jgi:hypothetical protein